MKNYKSLLIGSILLLVSLYSSAQVDTTFKRINLNYSDYMTLVGKNNLSLAAEKFNVDIAEAQIENAKVFPDPELSFGWFDNGQRRMNMGNGYNSRLGWTLELGGKRKARIDLARSEAELAKYLLQDYFRNLRADATLSYLQALTNKFLFNVQWSSYQSMNQLAQSDSIRFRLGSIMNVDARQSKLEAGKMLNSVYQGEVEWKMSLVNLSLLLAMKQSDSLIYPSGDFSKFVREFDLPTLIVEAQNNRADVLAALQNKNVSQNMLKLAKANRVIDLGLGAGFTYASYDRNIIAPTPSYSQVGAGVTIPLKFSNNYAGDLKAAYYNNLQSDVYYKQIELKIQNEIIQAYYNYLSSQKQVQQFNSGLLTEAKKVFDGKRYSYQRGETSLLEVLNAQRTYNDVQQNYYQALYNYTAALVELERAAGIWDINF
ncbi:MAG TPA: TolC family protein [Cytophagaceae bacterium]|jgi:cobalt-zinc-cadmium efflux system outer membrane protein|nr:TolC family protein [Cytophagaceae bacterium]